MLLRGKQSAPKRITARELRLLTRRAADDVFAQLLEEAKEHIYQDGYDAGRHCGNEEGYRRAKSEFRQIFIALRKEERAERLEDVVL